MRYDHAENLSRIITYFRSRSGLKVHRIEAGLNSFAIRKHCRPIESIVFGVYLTRLIIISTVGRYGQSGIAYEGFCTVRGTYFIEVAIGSYAIQLVLLGHAEGHIRASALPKGGACQRAIIDSTPLHTLSVMRIKLSVYRAIRTLRSLKGHQFIAQLRGIARNGVVASCPRRCIEVVENLRTDVDRLKLIVHRQLIEMSVIIAHAIVCIPSLLLVEQVELWRRYRLKGIIAVWPRLHDRPLVHIHHIAPDGVARSRL